MNRQSQDRIHPEIQGWGADLDHKNRPAIPKERTPPRFINAHWEQPEPQIQKVKILMSIERPHMTPVFGTSVPPSGLSGKIRGLAFKLSENDIRHWLLLLFADRVNVVEGLLSDLRRGHIPNLLAEMGFRAELKYNKRGAIRKVLVAAGLLSLTTAFFKKKRTSKKLA